MTERTDEGAVLRFFRFRLGLTEDQVGERNKVSGSLISQYELGEKVLSRQRLGELLSRFDVPPEAIDHALLALQLGRPPEGSASPVDPGGQERRLIRRASAAGAGAFARAAEAELTGRSRRRLAREARRWAARQWEHMKKLTAADRRLFIDHLHDERIWALAELLGQASVKAAAHRADQSLELAQLGLRAAQRIPEGLWRSLNEGFNWAYLGNARRVAGSLPDAREAFQTSDRLWKAGEGGDPSGVLDATRRLDLKASLLMNDDNCEEAVKLLDQAIAESRSEAARARLLLKESTALGLMGDTERLVEVLERAAPLIDERREPRLLWVHNFNLAVGLCDLERYGEAQDLLPRVREMAVELGNELDLTRTLWLDAKIKAGFGFLEEACAAFEQVCRVLADQKIAYDCAMASLDLAVVHLVQGHTREVKQLAEDMWWIFRAQEVHEEALAALKLFCDAARREEADAGWVRRLRAYLSRARGNPRLRFEP